MPKFEDDEPESEPEYLDSDDEEEDEENEEEEEEKDEVETTKQKDQRKKISGQITATTRNIDDGNEDYEPEEEPSDDDNDDDVDYDEDEDLDGVENQEEVDGDDDEDDDNDDNDEDEQEEGNDMYNKYFNEKLTKDYISEVHPECIPVNMVEVEAMLDVVRDEYGIIIDEFHKTLPFITKYEKTRIIGQRASQLDSGATPYITLDKNIIDSSVIAEMEFNQKKIPSIIKRPLPNGSFEYWKLSDLEILI
jgi:DNA-directed RNA polymerase subunit K/omega